MAIGTIVVAIDKPSLATKKDGGGNRGTYVQQPIRNVAIDDLFVATNLTNVAIACAVYSNHSQMWSIATIHKCGNSGPQQPTYGDVAIT
jgi:hypothetical protein